MDEGLRRQQRHMASFNLICPNYVFDLCQQDYTLIMDLSYVYDLLHEPKRRLELPASFVTAVQNNASYMASMTEEQAKKTFGGPARTFFVHLIRDSDSDASKCFAVKCMRLAKTVLYSITDFEVCSFSCNAAIK